VRDRHYERVSDQRAIDRDRLDIFEALLAAIDRRDEVSMVIAEAPDAEAATEAVRDLLGVAETPAREVMNMQWRRLTADFRKHLQDERDALRHRLDEDR
jgi:DNA gyrase/topoisomerase IV subunit A